MLYDYYKYFLNYSVAIYGGTYKVDDTVLFIVCGNDEFKVSLLDGSRFGEFTFYHKNKKPRNGYFHKHLVVKDLEYGIFRCFTHEFNREYGIRYNKDDWRRFEQDAVKYKLINT